MLRNVKDLEQTHSGLKGIFIGYRSGISGLNKAACPDSLPGFMTGIQERDRLPSSLRGRAVHSVSRRLRIHPSGLSEGHRDVKRRGSRGFYTLGIARDSGWRFFSDNRSLFLLDHKSFIHRHTHSLNAVLQSIKREKKS